MRRGKKILLSLVAITMFIACFAMNGMEAKAFVVITQPTYDENGLFFGHSVYDYDTYVDENGERILEGGTTVYVDKLRVVKKKGTDDYPTGTLMLYQNGAKTGDLAEIVAVKSNSKNLKCKITYRSQYTNTTENALVYGDGSGVKVSAKYADTHMDVTVLAKKTGTYKVTATVKLKDGTLVDKVATVMVTNKEPIEIKTDDSKLTTDGTYKANSVKVKVIKGKGVSNVQSYYSNTLCGQVTNADGSTKHVYNIYKKFKSGKKIKLNKKISASYTDVSEKGSHTSSKNYWYAPTYILVIYKDDFYGVTSYEVPLVLRKYRKIK